MKYILHRIAHLLNMNHGTVETEWTEKGNLLCWFQCSTCGQRSGVHDINKVVDNELRKASLNKNCPECGGEGFCNFCGGR